MCGIIGIYSNKDVSKSLYYGLFALQHRGQESCGIAVMNNDEMNCTKGMGLVDDVFKEDTIENLKGNIGIAHVRYSTAGQSHPSNSQPLSGTCRGKKLALVHNGNLVNADYLKKSLEDDGHMFQTSTDSEVILYILAKYYRNNLLEAVKLTMDYIKGAYSLVVMSEDELIAIRDPHGFRPLMIGKKDNDYIIASESSAINIIGGEVIRDIEPGEIVRIKGGEITSHQYKEIYKEKQAMCIFEYVYFARNDAVMDGVSTYNFRVNSGKILAAKDDIKADIVIPVPDSGWAGAIGYSAQSGIPLMEGLVKNRYIGRTFIKPTQEEREIAVKLKLNPLESVVKGKSIVLIDDSIVRGTTSKKIIDSLKKAGAKEIHIRITSPPVVYPCYFGIDTPRRSKLIAANNSVEEICSMIGATSLKFLDINGMIEATEREDIFCKACFNGEYPVSPMKEEE